MQRNGSWVPVDLTLVQRADGSAVPAAAPAAVTLGGAGANVIASLAVGAGSVGYGWSVPLPAPTLSGPTATYSDVFPGVDLVATVSTSGVEVSLLYKTAQAVAAHPSVSFPLYVSGLNSTVGNGGAVSYTDQSGMVVGRTPAPKGWDSRLGGTAFGPGNGPVASAGGQVKASAGASSTSGSSSSGAAALSQTVQVPNALATDPSTVYPILVDPSVSCTACGENLHGYVENDGDTEINSSFDGGTVHVGTFDGGTTQTRGLYSFAQGASHGTTINSATLELGNVWSWSCSARSMTVYKASAFSSSVTWSSATLATTANAVSESFAYGYSSSCAARQVDYPVTGIVADGANDASSYYYFQLRAGSETDSTYWKKFQSSAVLAVNYDTAPNIPSYVGFKSAYPTTPGCVRGSSRPTIDGSLSSAWQAKVSDPDSSQNVDVQFEWWDLATPTTTHTTSVSGSVASGSYAYVSFAGSTTTFVDGHNYGFRARAYDGQLYSGWSAATGGTTCEFHVLDPAPNAPTSLAFAAPNSMTCPPPLAVRGNQSLSFSAAISDPDNKYGKTDEAIFKVTVGSTVAWTWTSAYGGARTVTSGSMPANTVPDATSFTWSVQAYNGQKYSTVSSCSDTTNNSIPAAPGVSSGGVFGSPGSPSGHVGDSDTITLTSSGAVEFVWEASAAPLTSLPAPGACGGSQPDLSNSTAGVPGTAYTVCESQGGAWNQFSWRAMDPEFAITAVAYNSAGTASSAGSATFDVQEYPPNHAWLTDSVSISDSPTSLSDTFGGPPLTLTTGGTSWVSTEYPGEDTDPNAPSGGPTRYGTALELDGTGFATTGSAGATLTIDMSHSFTATVWVRPTHASSATPDWAMSEDGAVNSGFMLGQYSGYWAFCMPHTQTYSSPWDGDCAYLPQPSTTQYVGQWTLLTGVWDAQAEQMRLYVNDGSAATSGATATAAHSSTGAASGALAVGEAEATGQVPTWTGDILNPVTYPGIIDAGQLSALYTCGLPQDANAVCSS